MDINAARTNMLKQQLRTMGILDDRLLMLFNHIEREQFVPAGFQEVAYADSFIPLNHGQVMFSPALEAQILQTLKIQPQETVLEIGTGTGYLTALLAQLAHSVMSIDIYAEFTEKARINLQRLALNNIELVTGNAAKGWGKQQFDVILIAGSVTMIAPDILEQLAPQGRLFAVIGRAPIMSACLMTRTSEKIINRVLFETNIPPLLQAPQREIFVF